MADIRGEWIRSLSWRSSEKLGVRNEELWYRLRRLTFLFFFTLEGQGGLLLPCFFYGYKNG